MFWAVLLLAVVLRLVGAGYGLPAVFNSDEPHLVNVAVSFGAGSLNPHLFKYPTLWMYLLFCAYGALFLVWSGFGRLHSAADFGRYFVWTPAPFYLIGRLLAAALSVAALVPLYRAGRRWLGVPAAAAAAALIAVAPAVVEAAHSTKPDSLLLFWAALAWACSARYLDEGRRRALVQAGVAAGLAFSSQYTAAPLGVLLVSAWLARRWRAGDAAPLDLVLACFAFGAAFVAGSPYALLDFRAFWAALQDIRSFEIAIGAPAGFLIVLRNLFHFAGPWLAGLALVAGAAEIVRRDKPRALWLLLPVATYLLFLSRSCEGGWPRYLMAVYPALALLAATAVDAVDQRWGAKPALALAAAIALPGLWASASYDRKILLPDTRMLSAEWVEANIPQGKTLLLDQEHASPRVTMSRATGERLLAQARAAGHPRAKYYQYLVEGHPGGGYGVYRVLRDFKDLHSHPAHTAFSASGQPMLDVSGGLAAAKEAGVDYVVLTDWGADPERSPELARFFAEVRRQVRVAEFEPIPGRLAGPRIEVYRLR
ncbi:MAG: glycosyltransferase family 39 protein [Elusimicrobia bacterium]|nr:glycosyltransferase family 39 protein [Elusimicrobiota bacterium]